MWPIYVLFNKFLKADEHNVSIAVGNHSDLITMNKTQNTILPRSHFVQVPHIRQLHSWDCGLACVLMVLRTLGNDGCDLHVLVELCNTTSIWTVDLAYLLQRFSVSFAFFTVTLGANPDFQMEMFYKDHLSTDLVRVDRLFQKALAAGIDIQCRSIGGEELSVLILSGNHIAIALVDQYKLSRSWLEEVCVPGLYQEDTSYTGHFVVICGFDADKGEFDIRDPASSREYARITLNCLEESRKSFGTDEDLLLITL
ncbi:Gucd1 [Thalictrum thalictroides]|uniref:Gucd1 n=1 Tax=Thalictrum thalictroides TaxID=46969 RepID=A0A7J6X0G1_THATH|nr:Gucd1 [Thalictrum thalictroides]